MTKSERIEYVLRVHAMLRAGSINHDRHAELIAIIMRGYIA